MCLSLVLYKKRRPRKKRDVRAIGVVEILKACRGFHVLKKNVPIDWDHLIERSKIIDYAAQERLAPGHEDDGLDAEESSDEDGDEPIEHANTKSVDGKETTVEVHPSENFVTIGLIGI